MLLFTSPLARHQLTFTSLAEDNQHLELAANWAEGEWGYIRNMGVEYRQGVLSDMSEQVYIGVYGTLPAAMFALTNHDELPNARKLMYVYVDKPYRGFGFGKMIIEEARRLAEEAGAELIWLDTLKTKLTRMYEKQGAKVVGENHLFTELTDVLVMKV